MVVARVRRPTRLLFSRFICFWGTVRKIDLGVCPDSEHVVLSFCISGILGQPEETIKDTRMTHSSVLYARAEDGLKRPSICDTREHIGTEDGVYAFNFISKLFVNGLDTREAFYLQICKNIVNSKQGWFHTRRKHVGCVYRSHCSSCTFPTLSPF